MPVWRTDKDAYVPEMPAIGITGGISTGKSTFVNCLRGLLQDAKFFDADAMARQLTHHDEGVLAQIRENWSREAEKHRQSNEYFFADIPLLYETGGEKLCDRVVVVACSEEVQMQRVMKRMGLDWDSATAIIAAQIPLAEKMKRADHVVWNNGPQGLLLEQARFLGNLWTGE